MISFVLLKNLVLMKFSIWKFFQDYFIISLRFEVCSLEFLTFFLMLLRDRFCLFFQDGNNKIKIVVFTGKNTFMSIRRLFSHRLPQVRHLGSLQHLLRHFRHLQRPNWLPTSYSIWHFAMRPPLSHQLYVYGIDYRSSSYHSGK